MNVMIRFGSVAWLVVALTACATVPKPQELLALEQLREAPRFEKLRAQQKTLIEESDQAHKKALEAWEEEELDLSKHWSVMASIKVRTAMALVDQAATKKRLAQVKADLKRSKAAGAELGKQIREVDEKIQLYEQLAMAKVASKEKELALDEVQKQAEAQKAIAAAQLALKMADTVDGSKYAGASYALAQEMITKAHELLKAGNVAGAMTAAEAAKAKAEAAHTASQEKYREEKETASRQARNQELQRDAAAIGGVSVKLRTVGQTQQLILPLTGLFKRRATSPRSDKVGTLNAVGALLKKYPSYPVIVNGYTSHLVSSRQRYAVSQTRALQVVNHFVSMGLKMKRFATSGRGAENLIARRRSQDNDRVEIVILYQ